MRARVRAALAGAALAAALAGGACARRAPPPAPPSARHLVLVTIDTLRADRLGCYGSRDVATPNLDRLSREGAMAPEATAHVPLTRPSHMSLLTGRYPAEHGIRDNVSPSLPAAVPTLAEVLKRAGFTTAGFVSSIVLSAQSGLDRGFDTYSDRFEAGADDARFLNTLQKRGDAATGEAIAWLEARRGGRLFLWLHLYDPHDPYEPPEPYASRYADRPYDGEVAWSDELVGRLEAALARLGLREETLLVVTSDHGEGLGEHGENLHGYFIYESTLRVPFLVRGPGVVPGTRLAATERGVDLFPTALDLLGVARPAGLALSGRSLAGALRGAETLAEEPSYAESLIPLLHFGWSDLRALREGRWKYIQAPRPELYDLREDPGERKNLLSEQPSRAEALRSALGRRLAAERAAPGPASGAASVPPDLLEKLGALGYVGGGAPVKGTSPGADPKDKIEEFKLANRMMREGLVRLRVKDFAGSAARLEGLLRRGIESFEVHYYLGRALVGLRRYGDAAAHFEGAIRYLPAYTAAYESLAECRIAQGDLEAALEALHRGEAASPKDARLHEREAQVWRSLEKPAEAIRAYEAARALAPKDALLRIRLGELYRDAGQADKAVEAMREGLAIDPGPASYWNSLGMVLGGSGRLEEAERAFREAAKRDEKDPQYAYNLGLALLRQDRRQEAAGLFRKALALEPRFGAARARLAELGSR